MVTLGKSKLFREMSDFELEAIQAITETRSFSAGEIIFKEGDPGDGLYVVAEGMVLISTIVDSAQPRVLSRMGPGEFFGEMAVLENEPRCASATAEMESRLYFIPRNGLLAMLELSPRLAFCLVRLFSQRLRDFNRQYIQEALQSERLALVGRFARSIVHDFKNPLAIIGLAAELGAQPYAKEEDRRVAQNRIRTQVDRLSSMINELLEFTRGSQNPAILASTNYAAFIDQTVEETRPELEVKSVGLEYENRPPALNLPLDPRRLSHVFHNLFHNAIDAMPKGGKIILRFAVQPQAVLTEVEDTGPGISPEIAGSLFQPFATYGKSNGTGLGLSICQRIIHDHGGRIQSRKEEGHGAIFSFWLPLAQPEPPAGQSAQG